MRTPEKSKAVLQSERAKKQLANTKFKAGVPVDQQPNHAAAVRKSGRPLSAGRTIVQFMDKFAQDELPVAELKVVAEDEKNCAASRIAARRLLAAGGGTNSEDPMPEPQEREATKLVMDYTDGKPINRQITLSHTIQSPDAMLAELKQLAGLDRLAVGTSQDDPE